MKVPEYKFHTGIIFTTIILIVLLSACGIASRTANTGGTFGAKVSKSFGTSHSLDNIQRELHHVHEEWQGTPFILGGNSKRGVDCSSFTQIVFDRHFGIELPRNTREQIQVGDGVRRSAVRPGDLIFFRTTRRTLHVGIAVNGDEFLHASTSSGVMISSMSERYWATRFLGVRRVM
jgi:cell wall-associated NlpC family hydrolase